VVPQPVPGKLLVASDADKGPFLFIQQPEVVGQGVAGVDVEGVPDLRQKVP